MRLDTRGEQQRATVAAIERASGQMREGKLREGLETLEAVRQAYGELPQIVNAIADYKARRAPLATSALTKAMAEARQALLAQEGSQALEVLRKASFAVTFVDAPMQEDYRRLADEVTKAAKVKRGATDGLVVVQASKISPKLIISVAAAVIVAVVVAVVLLRAKPAATSYLVLNASPYAEVVKITAAKGGTVALPDGDHVTPLRLENLTVGSYTVVFKGSSGAVDTQQCKVSNAEHLCVSDPTPITDADVDAIVKGARNDPPWDAVETSPRVSYTGRVRAWRVRASVGAG